MKFLNNQPKKDIQYYFDLLKALSTLSNLFSDSSTPYLNYRVTENVFCKAFNAENLARSDISYDAKQNNIGIGIKTFINQKNGKFEKVSEFNALSPKIKKLEGFKLAETLADYRNERIDFANRSYGINEGIYHCITRSEKKLIIFESDYRSIDKDSLKIIKEKNSSLHFKDKFNYYLFNYSKSTLFQKFERPDNAIEINVKILDDPYSIILKLLEYKGLNFNKDISIPGKDFIMLPLYSTSMTKGNNKIVPEKSGLNQWNAGGRIRKPDEIYIPIPQVIHKNFPNFFPSREIIFNLRTPDNKILKAKLCQDNSKALMSNPNDALGHWLLRNVLSLKPLQILTYENLLNIGVDSVIVTKLDIGNYKIDFAQIDSYESFKDKYITE